jgi:hypothetical protein
VTENSCCRCLAELERQTKLLYSIQLFLETLVARTQPLGGIPQPKPDDGN